MLNFSNGSNKIQPHGAPLREDDAEIQHFKGPIFQSFDRSKSYFSSFVRSSSHFQVSVCSRSSFFDMFSLGPLK